MAMKAEDISISEMREAAADLKEAVAHVISYVRDHRGTWQMPPVSLPAHSNGWNFNTFEKFINQRFNDLSLQLRERYEAQQTGVTAALAAAEKAVNAALIAAEKAVDKAEDAQQLRNESQNEFRKSLSDLSGLMWTIKEGTASVDGLRRELTAAITNTETKVLSTDNKIEALSHARIEATETLRKALEVRIFPLEAGYSNIQGRIWAISAIWAVIVVATSIAVRFIGK